VRQSYDDSAKAMRDSPRAAHLCSARARNENHYKSHVDDVRGDRTGVSLHQETLLPERTLGDLPSEVEVHPERWTGAYKVQAAADSDVS